MDVDSTTEYGILDQSCLVVGGRNARSVLDTHGMVLDFVWDAELTLKQQN